MELSSLPWRIRSQIIETVVEENPQYGLIHKEWLQQAAKRHGKLNIANEAPAPTPVSLITPYIENASFNRVFNIDWDLICAYKRIKHVRTELISQDAREFEEISGKLLLLPALESLNLIMTGKTMDLSRVLKKNQCHLKLLRVPALCFNRSTSNLAFSNLKCLHLFGSGGFMALQDIVRNMPELRQLYVTSHTNLNHVLLPNITELCIQGYSRDVELNLNLFPNLVNLDASNVKLVNRGQVNGLVESIYCRSQPGFNSLSSVLFPQIRHLKLSFTVSHQHMLNRLYDSFAIMPELVVLELKVDQPLDIIKKLPLGFYSFRKLVLRGPFVLSPPSLKRLSELTSIVQLELHGCVFKDRPVKPVPFNALREVVITSDDYYKNRFMMYFNYTNFPNVTSIKFNNARECSQTKFTLEE